MKKTLLLAPLLLLPLWGNAQNLITNGDYEKPLTKETRLLISAGWASLKEFTEDTTWNKAVRMTISKLHENKKDNSRSFLAWICIGGDGSGPSGFSVEPESSYRFSLRLKTDILPEQAHILCKVVSFAEDGKKEIQLYKSESLKNLHQKEWTPVSGTFRTGKEKNAVLWIIVHSSTAYSPNMLPNIGNWVMVDNVVVEKSRELPGTKETGPTISLPQRRVYLPGQTYSEFRTLRGDASPTAPTEVTVSCGKDAFEVNVRCSEPEMSRLAARVSENNNGDEATAAIDPWKDDVVELFFMAPKDRKPSQFVVAAGGGRWTNAQGIRDSSAWSALVRKGKDAWSIRAEIPYKTLGFSGEPPGEILFSAARQRLHARELSSLSFLGDSFHNYDRFGILITLPFNQWLTDQKNRLLKEIESIKNATLKGEIQSLNPSDPVTAYNSILSIENKLRLTRLGESGMAVSLPPIGSDFHIPYIPDAVLDHTETIVLKAAVNELVPTPVSITNLSGKAEEYRVTLEYLDAVKGEHFGLTGEAGTIGRENLKIFRAIRSRDSELKNAAVFFDALEELGNAGTVVIPARDSALLWLRLNTAGLKPGKYRGAMRINPLSAVNPDVGEKGYSLKLADGAQSRIVPVELEIYPFELDNGPVVPFHGYSTPLFNENCLAVCEELGLNGFMLSPHLLRAEFDNEGHITRSWVHPRVNQDFTRTIRLTKDLVKRKKCFFLIGYGSYPTFYDVILEKKFPENSPQWKTAWSEWIGAYDKLLRDNGIGRDLYSHELWDEPDVKKVGHLMKPVAQIIAQDYPGIRKTITVTPYVSLGPGLLECAPYIDEFILFNSLEDPAYKDFLPQLKKEKCKLSLYKCDTNSGAAAYSYYRCFPWLILRENLDAISLYTAIAGYYQGAHDWRLMGGGKLLIRSFDDVVRTVRSDTLLAGFNDVRYMRLLKKMADASRDKKLAAEALAFYEFAPKQVLRKDNDPGFITGIRTQAISLIQKLQKPN